MTWQASIRSIQSLDPDIVPFWEGLTKHEFLLYSCTRCGKKYWPVSYCPGHEDVPARDEMVWVSSSGRGTVFSWVAVYEVSDPVFGEELPYVLALVELEEGPLFPTRLTDCGVDEVRVGLSVEVDYFDVLSTGSYPSTFPVGVAHGIRYLGQRE